MRILFLLLVIAILGLIHGYVGWRVIPPLGLTPSWQPVAWGLLAILAYSPLIPVLLRYGGHENRFIDGLSAAGYFSLGFFVLTFLAFLFRDVLLVLGLMSGKLLAKPELVPAASLVRFNTGILIFTGFLTLWGLWQARRLPVVEKINIPVAGLSSELEGFTIVQISDIHVGPTIKRSFVENIVHIVANLKPDLIALTGDLVDGSVAHLAKDVEPLRNLEAPYGKYFITGNHEYYSGVDSWLVKTKELGFINLINEHRTLSVDGYPLAIIGVTDLTAETIKPSHKTDVEKAARNLPEKAFKLLLAHQPGSVFAAARAGVDLMLTGHTHAGQFIPFNWLVARAHPYLEGRHRHGKTWLYVNRGTGYWGPPLRLGMTNEITVLTLRRGPLVPES